MNDIKELLLQGRTKREIAEMTEVSVSTVNRRLKEFNLEHFYEIQYIFKEMSDWCAKKFKSQDKIEDKLQILEEYCRNLKLAYFYGKVSASDLVTNKKGKRCWLTSGIYAIFYKKIKNLDELLAKSSKIGEK